MKQAMIHYMKNEKNDELYTPIEAVRPLSPYIPVTWTIWEPTDPGNSKIAEFFRSRTNKVISAHISRGQDFFTYLPDEDFDVIITNPPYSLKDRFLERAYEIGKPFCFLLPITTLEGVKRGRLFRKYGIQILVIDRRVSFPPNNKPHFVNTSWFCWEVLPKDFIFTEMN